MLVFFLPAALSLDAACGYLRTGSLWLPHADCQLAEAMDFKFPQDGVESSAGFDRGAATAGALVETEQC